MISGIIVRTTLLLGLSLHCLAEEDAKPEPVELEALKASIGVWDAEIEVWPAGLDAPSTTFKGVETNRAFGKYWIASDFDSEFEGQTMSVHSIVGYDPEKKGLVGTVIDHGPYAAEMTGRYDADSKTVRWEISGRHANGKPLLQKTEITHKSASERVLVLMMPGEEEGEFTKFMQIKFVKRK